MCFIDCLIIHKRNVDNLLRLQESKSECSSYMSFTKYLSLSHRREGLMFDNNYIYLSIQFSIRMPLMFLKSFLSSQTLSMSWSN